MADLRSTFACDNMDSKFDSKPDVFDEATTATAASIMEDTRIRNNTGTKQWGKENVDTGNDCVVRYSVGTSFPSLGPQIPILKPHPHPGDQTQKVVASNYLHKRRQLQLDGNCARDSNPISLKKAHGEESKKKIQSAKKRVMYSDKTKTDVQVQETLDGSTERYVSPQEICVPAILHGKQHRQSHENSFSITRPSNVNSEAALMRSQIASKEYELQRLQKVAKFCSGNGNTNNIFSSAVSISRNPQHSRTVRDAMGIASHQADEIQSLRAEYTALTGSSYEKISVRRNHLCSGIDVAKARSSIHPLHWQSSSFLNGAVSRGYSYESSDDLKLQKYILAMFCVGAFVVAVIIFSLPHTNQSSFCGLVGDLFM